MRTAIAPDGGIGGNIGLRGRIFILRRVAPDHQSFARHHKPTRFPGGHIGAITYRQPFAEQRGIGRSAGVIDSVHAASGKSGFKGLHGR
jgi:hypothetical protein